ncbi:MAG: class I SAM-dependent methyltransferase [Pseudomonadota bacterium]
MHPEASAWVRRFLPLIAKNNGPVLDLACGSGRHTRLLLDAGYEVWSLDKDASLLAPLAVLGARCFQRDLEMPHDGIALDGKGSWPFEANTFSAIIVTNYLYRPLLANLTSSLKDGGILIYETFAAGNESYGSPRNPDFLLQPGELIEYYLSQAMPARKNHCIAFEHGHILHPRPAVVQRICLRCVPATSAIDTTGDHLEGI